MERIPPMPEKQTVHRGQNGGRAEGLGELPKAIAQLQHTISPAKNPDVEVLKLTAATRTADGCRAFVTVRVGAITITGIRVLLVNGKARIELPHLQAADGRRWACVSINDADLAEYVSDAVLASWRDAVMFLGLGAKHR